jgi:methionyl-tRNA synthetase
MKDIISYDDFQKLDIRIGQILSVEEVPETDKLLKLTVDLGEEVPRTIVSGIREHIADVQGLVGKKTTFVANLEPRTIRGIESNGMLFAIGDPQFSFLSPDADVPSGAPLI